MRRVDLFISHSSADTQVAESIVTELEKRGIACWYAPRDVELGGEYQGEIVQALDAARAVLLIFSKNANASQHILREIELAVQDRKPVYPIRIDGTMPSHGLRYLLANKQWVDHKDPISGLVDRIERLMRRAEPASDIYETHEPVHSSLERTSGEPSNTVRRSRLILPASIAGICLVIAGGWLVIYGRDWVARPIIAPQATPEPHRSPVPRERVAPQASADSGEARVPAPPSAAPPSLPVPPPAAAAPPAV